MILRALLLGSLCLGLGPRAEAQPTPHDVPDLSTATLEALPKAPGLSRAGRLLTQREFAKLDALLTKAHAAGRQPDSFESWLAAHTRTIARLPLLPHLDAWCQAAPRSAFARLVRGEAWAHAGLRLRGSRPPKAIDPDRRARISARLKRANANLTEAHQLDPKLAPVAALQISVLAGLNAENAELETWFGRAVDADANDVSAHVSLLTALTPDQGGAWATMFAFARKCAASGKTEPALYYPLALAHEFAARASNKPGAYLDRPAVKDELRPALKALGDAYPSALPALRLRARLDRLRKNDATRATWRQLLADADDPAALLQLGAADGKRPAGLRMILRAAYLGSAPAALWVALRLKAQQRWTDCAAWLTVAYDRGNADAAFDLGLLKWRGHGVPKDRRGAITLWRESASLATPASGKKAQRWLEYVLNKHPELLRKPKRR